MHVNIVKPQACVTAVFEGRCFAERQAISPTGCGQLVQMLITLVARCIFETILHTYTVFEHCPATGMQNGDRAAGRI